LLLICCSRGRLRATARVHRRSAEANQNVRFISSDAIRTFAQQIIERVTWKLPSIIINAPGRLLKLRHYDCVRR
jgi:hypothetical protein